MGQLGVLTILSTDRVVDLSTLTLRAGTVSLTLDPHPRTPGPAGVAEGLVVGPADWLEDGRADTVRTGTGPLALHLHPLTGGAARVAEGLVVSSTDWRVDCRAETA